MLLLQISYIQNSLCQDKRKVFYSQLHLFNVPLMRGFAYIAAHTQIFEREAVLGYYFSVISSCQGAYCQKFFVYVDVFETECGFTVLIDLYETFYY